MMEQKHFERRVKKKNVVVVGVFDFTRTLMSLTGSTSSKVSRLVRFVLSHPLFRHTHTKRRIERQSMVEKMDRNLRYGVYRLPVLFHSFVQQDMKAPLASIWLDTRRRPLSLQPIGYTKQKTPFLCRSKNEQIFVLRKAIIPRDCLAFLQFVSLDIYRRQSAFILFSSLPSIVFTFWMVARQRAPSSLSIRVDD